MHNGQIELHNFSYIVDFDPHNISMLLWYTVTLPQIDHTNFWHIIYYNSFIAKSSGFNNLDKEESAIYREIQ